MADRNAPLGCHFVHNGRLNKYLHKAKDNQPENRTYNIEKQMDKCRSSGVLVGADGRKKGSDTGTDILSHNNGNGSSVCHLSRGGKRLQDTHGSGTGLDNGGQ